MIDFNSEKASLNPARILIVDDVARNVQVLASVLNKQGYQIGAAFDGEQALNSIKDLAPDLILLDVMMPGIDGLEVCRRLKKEPNTARIPVILLTALTAQEDIIAGFRAGAVDYITKPFKTRELIARVQTHVRLKAARDSKRRLVKELKAALSQVRTLSGLLPICPKCKRVRSDKGYWQQIEEYVMDHAEAKFSHGICPPCVARYYPEFAGLMGKKND